MKTRIHESEIEGIDKTWCLIKKEIEQFLDKRLKLIETQFLKDIDDKQFKKLQTEEKFVAKVADFMNDCESYVNVHKKQIVDLEYTIVSLQNGMDEDRKIFSEINKENERVNKILNELLKAKETGILLDIAK
jgi:hypothetical protein